MSDLVSLGQGEVLGSALADVAAARERARRRRLRWLTTAVSLAAAWLWVTALSGERALPALPAGLVEVLPILALVAIIGLAVVGPMLGAGRSPHVLYRPSEIDIGLDDVKGAGIVKDEVVRTLNLFLAYKTFRERMGGTPRRAILFEGRRARARPTWPRPWPPRPVSPSSSCRRRPSSRCTTARPTEDPQLLPGPAQRGPQGGRGHRLHRGDRRHRRGSGRHGRRGPARQRGRRGQRAAHPAPELRRAGPVDPAAGVVHRPGQPLPAPCASPACSRPTCSSWGPPTGRPTSTPPSCAPAASTAASTSAFPAEPTGGRSSTTTWPRRRTWPTSTTLSGSTAWPP